MDELHKLKIALGRQRRRLAELMEICGGLDLEHPLQMFSLRRMAWLEARIAEEERKRA